MTRAIPVFSDVVDAADRLSRDEKEELIAILHRRLAEEGRHRLIADIQESREEFAAGKCRPATPDEILREIQS